MSTEFLVAVMGEFQLSGRETAARLESRSGAGVHAVRTADGQSGYLKVTPAALGPGSLAAARRELRFYREVAPIAPVRTPALLAWTDNDSGVALLLEAAGEPREAAAWTVDMWAGLGRELAALHSMPIPAGTAPAEPGADVGLYSDFWGPEFADVLSRHAEMLHGPQVFIHGDCHTDNIVYAGDSAVFCDWQAAGTGRATADLALLSVRVTPAGLKVPPALVSAYRERRPLDGHALAGEELAILLFQWPAFAAFNTPAGIANVRRRASELTNRWLSGRG